MNEKLLQIFAITTNRSITELIKNLHLFNSTLDKQKRVKL